MRPTRACQHPQRHRAAPGGFQTLQQESLAQQQSLEQLKSDVETREQELERLRAMEEADQGARIRSFTGDGDRQYLTGLKVGGQTC
jgi:hypothetical protein